MASPGVHRVLAAALCMLLLDAGCTGLKEGTSPSVPAPAPLAPAAASGSAAAGAPAAPDATAPASQAAATPGTSNSAGAKPAAPAAKAPTKAAATAVASAKPSPTAQAGKPAAPPLDIKALETHLKETSAIGVMTKLSLKNDVDDLLDQFRTFYQGKLKTTLAELRRPFDLLVLKLLSLLQDSDPSLAAAILASREAIWGILSDPVKFATLDG
jgi:hypothetical protein